MRKFWAWLVALASCMLLPAACCRYSRLGIGLPVDSSVSSPWQCQIPLHGGHMVDDRLGHWAVIVCITDGVRRLDLPRLDSLPR